MADLLTKKPAHSEGWYWSSSDDGPCYGPFETAEIARDEFWHDGAGQDAYNDAKADDPDFAATKEEFLASWEYIARMAKPAIVTDVFDADWTLEAFEEKNEFAVWADSPPQWNDSEAKRELELMLADALYRWAEKHDAWKEFRCLT